MSHVETPYILKPKGCIVFEADKQKTIDRVGISLTDRMQLYRPLEGRIQTVHVDHESVMIVNEYGFKRRFRVENSTTPVHVWQKLTETGTIEHSSVLFAAEPTNVLDITVHRERLRNTHENH